MYDNVFNLIYYKVWYNVLKFYNYFLSLCLLSSFC